MSRTGILKNMPFISQLLLCVGFVVLGSIFCQVLFYGILLVKNGFSKEIADNLLLRLNENGELLREFLFLQTVCVFFIPALFMSGLFSENFRTYLSTEIPVSGLVIILTIFSVFLSIPCINYIAYWNEQLRLPESMKAFEESIRAMENQAQAIFNTMLVVDNFWEFLMNILIVGVLAAVGEEFLFRGVLQNIFSKVIKNQHVVIWIVAIIFSLIHFQFYGFFARVLLGAYLGYLLYYSKSIWVPVLAHFTNNAFGVIYYYVVGDAEKLKQVDEIGTGSTSWITFVSLILFIITFLFLKKILKKDLQIPNE